MKDTLEKIAGLLEGIANPGAPETDEDYVKVETSEEVQKFIQEHMEALQKCEDEEERQARARHLMYVVEELTKAFDASDKFSGSVPVPASAKLRMFKDPGQWPHTLKQTSMDTKSDGAANYTSDSTPAHPAVSGTRPNSGDKQPPVLGMPASGNPWVPAGSHFAKRLLELTELLKTLLPSEEAPKTEEASADSKEDVSKDIAAGSETKHEGQIQVEFKDNIPENHVKVDGVTWLRDMNTPEFLGEDTKDEEPSDFNWGPDAS